MATRILHSAVVPLTKLSRGVLSRALRPKVILELPLTSPSLRIYIFIRNVSIYKGNLMLISFAFSTSNAFSCVGEPVGIWELTQETAWSEWQSGPTFQAIWWGSIFTAAFYPKAFVIWGLRNPHRNPKTLYFYESWRKRQRHFNKLSKG